MKVGDNVKVVGTDYVSPELANGQTGVIGYIQLISGDTVVGVVLDNGFTPNDICAGSGDEWAFYPNQLEVV